MRLLALETTSEAGSVALLEGERLAALRALEPEAYSMQLLPAVIALLGELGWQAHALDAVAAAAGPGSFTGVRVGLSAAKGIIEAWQKPALAVSTLSALAASPADAPEAGAPAALDSPAIALLDAARQEVYFGIYPAGPLAAALAGTPTAVDRAAEAASAQTAAALQAGAAPVAYLPGASLPADPAAMAAPPAAEAAIEGLESLAQFARRLETLPPWPVYLLDPCLGERLGLPACRLRPRAGRLAAGVGRLAAPLLAAGRAAGALELDARYLRRSDAELISLPRLLQREKTGR